MDQKQKKIGFSYKSLLLNLLLCFAIVLLLHLMASFVLLRIPHFNSYFSTASWAILVLSTASIAAFQKKAKPLFINAVTWAIFSLLMFILGLFLTGENFDFFYSFLKCSLQFVLTLIFAILFRFLAAKKHPRNKKFHFSK